MPGAWVKFELLGVLERWSRLESHGVFLAVSVSRCSLKPDSVFGSRCHRLEMQDATRRPEGFEGCSEHWVGCEC